MIKADEFRLTPTDDKCGRYEAQPHSDATVADGLGTDGPGSAKEPAAAPRDAPDVPLGGRLPGDGYAGRARHSHLKRSTRGIIEVAY